MRIIDIIWFPFEVAIMIVVVVLLEINEIKRNRQKGSS